MEFVYRRSIILLLGTLSHVLYQYENKNLAFGILSNCGIFQFSRCHFISNKRTCAIEMEQYRQQQAGPNYQQGPNLAYTQQMHIETSTAAQPGQL